MYISLADLLTCIHITKTLLKENVSQTFVIDLSFFIGNVEEQTFEKYTQRDIHAQKIKLKKCVMNTLSSYYT